MRKYPVVLQEIAIEMTLKNLLGRLVRLFEEKTSWLFVHQQHVAMLTGGVDWSWRQIIKECFGVVPVAVADVHLEPQAALGAQPRILANWIQIDEEDGVFLTWIARPRHLRLISSLCRSDVIAEIRRHTGWPFHLARVPRRRIDIIWRDAVIFELPRYERKRIDQPAVRAERTHTEHQHCLHDQFHIL